MVIKSQKKEEACNIFLKFVWILFTNKDHNHNLLLYAQNQNRGKKKRKKMGKDLSPILRNLEKKTSIVKERKRDLTEAAAVLLLVHHQKNIFVGAIRKGKEKEGINAKLIAILIANITFFFNNYLYIIIVFWIHIV